MNDPLIILHSHPSDMPAVWRLAALDDRRAPHAPALLAYVGTELRAALGLRDGQVVADPFHRTDDIVEMLRVEARFEEAA
jgi:hypothetical protein